GSANLRGLSPLVHSVPGDRAKDVACVHSAKLIAPITRMPAEEAKLARKLGVE
ncbi:hypothetical protein QTP70_028912, partial [Hemibagrus guttatus]